MGWGGRARRAAVALGAVGILAVVLLGPAAVARACAVCGAGPGAEGDPLGRGLYWGMLFLMAMPFAVAGALGGWVLRRYRRARDGSRGARRARGVGGAGRPPAGTTSWAEKENRT